MFKLCVLLAVAASSYAADLRIIGGDEASILDFPYVVSIRYLGLHCCSGVIINNNTILTAAQCTKGKTPTSFTVMKGDKDLNGHNGGSTSFIEKVTTYENFDSETMDGDIAVLKTMKPMLFNNKVKPIELQEQGVDAPAFGVADVVGWGATHEDGTFSAVLRKTKVNILAQNVCAGFYGKSLTDNMLCASAPGKDACKGDQGGPLVWNEKLVGIVSWGKGCARPNNPGVYAKISALRSWIDKVVEDEQ